MNKDRFKAIWKHLYSLYQSSSGHCLKHGCSSRTLAYWANKHYSKHNAVESWHVYREALKIAVNLGFATESSNTSGCRKYCFKNQKVV